MNVKTKQSSDLVLVLRDHVKNDIPISRNNYRDFQQLFKSQIFKFRGER